MLILLINAVNSNSIAKVQSGISYSLHLIIINLKKNVMSVLFDRLNEGGAFFMYPLLLILIVVTVLIVQGLLKRENSEKTIKLISSITLFALVWGFLGQLIGMIGGFDAIDSIDTISPAVLAGGLKVSLLPPVFGSVVFLIGRLGIITLTWIKK